MLWWVSRDPVDDPVPMSIQKYILDLVSYNKRRGDEVGSEVEVKSGYERGWEDEGGIMIKIHCMHIWYSHRININVQL